MKEEAFIASVRQVLEDSLREGTMIEIDGIGTLEFDSHGELIFKRNDRARIFLAYAQEDRSSVKRLYDDLHAAGFEPWMDTENLLPGQNWPRAIERAIELSDYFVGCFSCRSAAKRGHFQSELSYALNIATRVPAEQPFFLPLRLDDCDMPRQISTQVHHVDLWPDRRQGTKILIRALRSFERRKKKRMS